MSFATATTISAPVSRPKAVTAYQPNPLYSHLVHRGARDGRRRGFATPELIMTKIAGDLVEDKFEDLSKITLHVHNIERKSALREFITMAGVNGVNTVVFTAAPDGDFASRREILKHVAASGQNKRMEIGDLKLLNAGSLVVIGVDNLKERMTHVLIYRVDDLFRQYDEEGVGVNLANLSLAQAFVVTEEVKKLEIEDDEKIPYASRILNWALTGLYRQDEWTTYRTHLLMQAGKTTHIKPDEVEPTEVVNDYRAFVTGIRNMAIAFRRKYTDSAKAWPRMSTLIYRRGEDLYAMLVTSPQSANTAIHGSIRLVNADTAEFMAEVIECEPALTLTEAEATEESTTALFVRGENADWYRWVSMCY